MNQKVSLRLPADLAERLDSVVDGGVFKSRSAAIRHAVMALLSEVNAGGRRVA